jgi:hypothetical protein
MACEVRAALMVRSGSRLLPREDLWREFRVVAGVDEVVRDSRVFSMGAIELLKQVGRLLLSCMRFVCRRCIRQKRERVKHLCFDVSLVLCGENAHRVLVAQRSRLIRNGGSVLIDQAKRMDELPLAFGASPELPRPLNFLLRN